MKELGKINDRGRVVYLFGFGQSIPVPKKIKIVLPQVMLAHCDLLHLLFILFVLYHIEHPGEGKAQQGLV